MTKEEKERAIANNIICFSKLDAIKYAVVNGADVYSEVAAEIFNCSPDDCREWRFDEHGGFNIWEEGKTRRNVAKYLCLNLAMIDDIASKFNVPDLCDRVISAFPYTMVDLFDAEENDPFIKEDQIMDSTTFITLIRGYCIIPYYKKKFNQVKEDFWNE